MPCFSIYASDTTNYDKIDDMQVKATIDAILNPAKYFRPYPEAGDDSSKFDSKATPSEQFIGTAYSLYQTWLDQGEVVKTYDSFTTSSASSANDIIIQINVDNKLENSRYGRQSWFTGFVTTTTISDNINYVAPENFYATEFRNLGGVFEKILQQLMGHIFVPVSGDNDAGVGDSITYKDPLGEYMELKKQAIHATVHDSDTEGVYDMALLVFGRMHGLVRAGTYDWQWNDDYMRAHGYNAGTAPFPFGWYWGDDPADAKTAEELDVDVLNAADGSGTYPARNPVTGETYANPEQAWADGWVYRFNLATLLQFVPLNADLDDSVHPADAPEQIKNTVYTCYRFAGSKTDRNRLYRNPVYGPVPTELQETWSAFEKTGDYPVGMDLYSEVLGVYRLSDIRVWEEHTGDFIDQTGAITPEDQSGYDDSLYVNIPVAAVPTQLAEITLGPDGPIAYETNLGDDHQDAENVRDYYAQSTPFRLFYAVGLTEDLILRDRNDRQTGVDISKISGEYIADHTDPDTGNIYFLSNWYSNTLYSGYTSDAGAGYSTRGDATVTFSPDAQNRYYLFQKPLPLFSHAWRVTDEDGTLARVDNEENVAWKPNGAGNGGTKWENGETPYVWSGGEFLGTYQDQKAFQKALQTAREDDTGYILDDKGFTYPLPEHIQNAVITFTGDQLNNVQSDASGNYKDGAVSFSSDDYFFLCVEYYVPIPGTTGADINGKLIPGSTQARKVTRVIARKGSAFGSGLQSEHIGNGDMLCWYDISGTCTLELEYNSRTDTGDNTRGQPTFEKLTYQGEELRKYLADCGLSTTKGVTVKDESGTETLRSYLDMDYDYWTSVQSDSHMVEILTDVNRLLADGREDDARAAFDALFDWAVSARTNGIRVGDMFNNVRPKGDNTVFQEGSDRYYKDNLTETANNYYVPTLSPTSTAGDGLVIDNYLGNNGRLEVSNATLMVTKTLTPPDGFTLTPGQQDQIFDYQVYVQDAIGERSVQRVIWNPLSQSWQKRVESLDILTDNSSLVLDTAGSRALFCWNGGEPRQVLETVVEGVTKYYYADATGVATEEVCNEGPDSLYYMYLPGKADEHTYHLFGSRYEGYYDEEDNYLGTTERIVGAGTTAYVPSGTDTEDWSGDNSTQLFAPEIPGEGLDRRPAGSREYWTSVAILIPQSEVLAAESSDTVESESGDGGAAGAALQAAPSDRRWDYSTADPKNHLSVDKFTLVTVIPDPDGTNSTIYSPFSSRTQYMSTMLYFGYTSELAEHLKATGETYNTCAHLDAYVLQADALYDPAVSPANTAAFTLRDGEGLMLTGLRSNIVYRFTEKLTEAQRVWGYTLKEITHVQQEGRRTIPEGDTSTRNCVYSVFGDTGFFTEEVHYVNTVAPEMLVVTKQIVGEDGRVMNPAPDKAFTFILTLTDTGDTAIQSADGVVYLWKGSLDGFTSDLTLTDAAGGVHEMPETAPALNAYQAYTGEGTDGKSLMPLLLTENEDGAYTCTFNLKANEAAVLYGLAANTKYTVTEARMPNYPISDRYVEGDVHSTLGAYNQEGTVTHYMELSEDGVYHVDLQPSDTGNRNNFYNEVHTGTLTVEKFIHDDNRDKVTQEFTFTVTLTPMEGTVLVREDLSAVKYGKNEAKEDGFTLDWTDAEGGGVTATFTLRHGERVVIDGIPYNTNYKVAESDRGGYHLEHVAGNHADRPEENGKYLELNRDDDSVSGTVTQEKQDIYLLFDNAKPIEMPFTGGIGRDMFYIIGGSVFLLASGIVLGNLYRKSRIRVE